ncbi:MAG: hypothetical protein HY327_10440 [Chloroflexi bacterium]|nr:hypothetical protein [Chloroflexota bacterium]
MNELFSIKYDELLTEFNRFIIEHPDFLENIPDEALLVFVDRADQQFTQFNVQRAEESRKNDVRSNRPIIYIEIGELAPIHSRLINPRVVNELPGLVTA